MVAEQRKYLEDTHKLEISKRHWVVTLGKAVARTIKDEGTEPTPKVVIKYFSKMKPDEREELFLIAHSLISSEYDEIYTLALMSGFDEKAAARQVREIIKDRYQKIEEDTGKNFSFLDSTIFQFEQLTI